MNFEEYRGRRTPFAFAAGEQVAAVIVEHQDFKRILSSAIDMVETMHYLKIPSGIIIQAESGMGKTLILQLIKKHFAEANAGLSNTPCLEIELDSAVDTPTIAAAMMLAMGYPMLPSRPNIVNMNETIRKGLTRLRPKVLLVDEMQHICEGNRDITARGVTDWLKIRMDRFNFPLIGTGTRTLDRLSVINPQFTNRASTNFVLQPFEFGDSWRQLLGAFAEAVSAVNFGILNGKLARALHVATSGNLRTLKRLLAYAAMYATERPENTVSVKDFARAFEDTKGFAPGRANPFSVGDKGAASS